MAAAAKLVQVVENRNDETLHFCLPLPVIRLEGIVVTGRRRRGGDVARDIPISKGAFLNKAVCTVSGRELSMPETFVNLVDGEFALQDNEPSDDWRPIGREHVQPLRDRGVMLSGLLTPL